MSNPLIAWLPTANLAAIKARAKLLAQIRTFFAAKNILEVETPLLCSHTVSEPYIDSFALSDQVRFLQTSPEYAMKRLLAAASGSIYQICKAFRNDPVSDQHNPEFTMLEYYRLGFDQYALSEELGELLAELLNLTTVLKYSYAELFTEHLQIDPHNATLFDLINCIKTQSINIDLATIKDKSFALDLLFNHCIEPKFPEQTLIFVHEYPKCQSALAKVANNRAQRFEVYYDGLELANGFHELIDASLQRQRFRQDNQKRQQLGLSSVVPDEYLLNALEHGLPHCAGVAVGIDRLLMCQLQTKDIRDVLCFNYERC